MSAAAPPRPTMPARPAAPPPRATVPAVAKPVAQAPVNQAPVNQAPVNQAPVNQAPVNQAPAAQVAQVSAPAAQVAQVSSAAGASASTPPKKGGRQWDLSPYWGCFAYNDSGEALYDEVTVEETDPATKVKTTRKEMQPRRKKLDAVPVLVAEVNADGSAKDKDDSGFNPRKHVQLKPQDFVKLGDYYRFQSAVSTFHAGEYAKKAIDADSGKLVTRASPQAVQAKMAKLLEILAAQCSPEKMAEVQAMLAAMA